MPKEFIVAIELGSSKMTGIAGKKNLDGSIQVLACVREDASACIRKGVVYNIDKTAQCITSIVNRLEKQLKTVVTQVYVGVGGQSIRSGTRRFSMLPYRSTRLTRSINSTLSAYSAHTLTATS